MWQPGAAGPEMAERSCNSSSSIDREQFLQSKFLDSLVRSRHGVGSQQGHIHPLDSNGLDIHDADETHAAWSRPLANARGSAE